MTPATKHKVVDAAQETGLRPLELIETHKLAAVLGVPPGTRLEASGICTSPDAFYVIFDNRPDIARITRAPGLVQPDNRFLDEKGAGEGHEDICYDPRTGHFYVLIEAMKDKDGEWASVVDEYDGDFNLIERRFVDFPFESENKGFEGIAYVYGPEGAAGDAGYLALLCEGNRCKSGKAGRTPGGGRVHIFRKDKKRWKHVVQINLPASLPFEDYSGIEVLDGYIAIASQASAMVWVARVVEGDPVKGDPVKGDRVQGDRVQGDPVKGNRVQGDPVKGDPVKGDPVKGAPVKGAPVAFDAGALFEFPRDAAGEVVFCNVEGIAWAGKNLLVAVSDRIKSGDQDPRCAQHDQSIQLFRIPPAAGEGT